MAKQTAKRPARHGIVQIEVPAKPRKRPSQERSVMLVDSLKKAGREILEKEGRNALSAARLSERAGVATSSIYEYFPTMESLIAAVFEDCRDELRRKLPGKVQALPATATLLDGILLIVESGLGLLREWSLIDPEFNIRSAYYEELVRLSLVKPEHFCASFVIPTLMARFSEEMRIHDRERAGFFVCQTLLAVSRSMILEKPEYLGKPDTPFLLARMLHALLTTDAESFESA
ncbi:helix-turn-helix domain-containing protein [Cupriavidus sp. IDO]|uniref:helix-turn-helix domain-containing protein n=1 Tax=Cupriavidus sp. IDO TaxID=1539142 RepID=UPI0005798F0E|nr:helix-turn-helix domain-containing protein [Cupriavidus sp. IDO]KWR88343.1 TetR family transcriptional regulator [Cupriavidus sp. IDO]